MPELERLHREHARGVRFLGIAKDLNDMDNRRAIQEVVGRLGVTFEQFLESDGVSLGERIFGKGTTTLPAFALFGKDGSLRVAFLGSLANAENRDRLIQELRGMMAANADVGGTAR